MKLKELSEISKQKHETNRKLHTELYNFINKHHLETIVKIELTSYNIKIYSCNLVEWNEQIHNQFSEEFGVKLVSLKKMEIYSHDKYISGIRFEYININDDSIEELKWNELKW